MTKTPAYLQSSSLPWRTFWKGEEISLMREVETHQLVRLQRTPRLHYDMLVTIIILCFSDSSHLSTVVSEAFVRFFVELVGHYQLFLVGEREDGYSSSSSSPVPCSFQCEGFRKAIPSKSVRRFLEVFMETQMFGCFIQEREHRRQAVRGKPVKQTFSCTDCKLRWMAWELNNHWSPSYCSTKIWNIFCKEFSKFQRFLCPCRQLMSSVQHGSSCVPI